MYIRCDCLLNVSIPPGETSSGKSTLLSLILGEHRLPCSGLDTSPAICELKYGPTPKLVAHFKDKDPQIGNSFVHVMTDRENESGYKKIELFLPHNLLKVCYDSRHQKLSSKRQCLVLVGVITKDACEL